MTPEERFERLERAHEEHDEWLREMQKRHEDAVRNHESWLTDHDRWMREMEQAMSTLIRAQNATELALKAFIDSLRKGGDGQGS